MDNDLASEPLNATVLDIVDDWAASTPSATAAEFQGNTITYAELRNASLHVSHALLSAGVRPRDRVPLLTDMSLDMLPAMIGILRVGACFVPLDVAAWSRTRIEGALSELSSPMALVTSPCPGLELAITTVHFQEKWFRQPLEATHGLLVRLQTIRSAFHADYLAWIIFTSGTTGRPKGVMVYHRGIQALIPEFRHYDNLEPKIDHVSRSLRITTTTLIYAAWSLFLGSIMAEVRVGFSVSLSGRTVPWPEAQSVLGSLVGRGVFSAHIVPETTVHEWLTQVHKTTLDLIELDGLTHALPESLMADPRTNTTNVLCFLDMPQSSPNWSFREQQGHNYLIDWYIFLDSSGGVQTEFEVQTGRVDLEWAKAVASLPGRLLDQLVHTTPETLVKSLLE